MKDRDPGLQPERTRLAWRRTSLSCVVAAVLAGKAALHGGVDAVGLIAVALCALLFLGFLTVADRRITALSARRIPPAGLTPRMAAAAAGCTVGLAVCGAVILR